MEMNTIYGDATDIAYLLFAIYKYQYATKIGFMHPTMRLKNFIPHPIAIGFVTLTAKCLPDRTGLD